MLYAIICDDVPDSVARRPAVRPRHLAYLQPLVDAGRLVIAGPHPAIDVDDPGPAGYTGSLIIAEFDSLTAAQQWAEQDPYWTAGIYARIAVKPLRKVLP